MKINVLDLQKPELRPHMLPFSLFLVTTES